MDRSPETTGQLFTPPETAEAPERVEGALETITFHNEENGFTVARIRTFDGGQVTVTGTFAGPIIGEALELWGKWETHRQYGRQFRVTRYRVHKPTSTDALKTYLGSGVIAGVRASLAHILVNHFGLDTLEIIEQHPERLTEVPGIGKKKAQAIIDGWEAQREVRDIMLFLQGHGVSAAYAMKIYRQYGDRAIAMVQQNPYRLAHDVFGIGFKMADRIAGRLGFAPDTPARIEAGLLYALQQASDQGHCSLPEEELARAAVGLLAAPVDPLPAAPADPPPAAPAGAPTVAAAGEAVARLIARGLLVRDPAATPPAIYRTAVFQQEEGLARLVRGLLERPLISPWLPQDVPGFVAEVCRGLEITLAPEQGRAVMESLTRRVLVLTGGPGTGKTTTTRAILAAHQRCGRTVALASPTGRAAKRLAEVTGCAAQTIHRLLEVDPTSFQFKRTAEHPLECEVLIVDEVSMVDLALAYALVRALPAHAQLILVGDADQLPSVGAGNVLRDIIASGRVPVVRLTEIFRQAAESTIITNAHRVHHGEMPQLLPTSHWQTADCLFIPQDDPPTAAQKVADVVCRSLPTLGYAQEEIQVLTPMQRGVLGAQHLNELLQAALNPQQLGVAEYTRGQKTLRCGDRVIQTVNNYALEVFNGDIGYLRHVDQEDRLLVVAYPEREVSYTYDDADELQLAYALTVHKSQGSEYPAAVVVLHTQHYLLLQRNLLYTALTRAKKLAVLLGSKRAVALAVRNQHRQARYTRLEQRLREGDGDEAMRR